MNPSDFVEKLEQLRFDNTFNPYSDQCGVQDLEDAPRHRSEALLKILKAASVKAASDEGIDLWVGLALGYRGGRRTGLAFTDDVHFCEHVKRWGLSIERPSRGSVAEQTARTVWEVLSSIERPVFLWNVFPLHPHELGNPRSNRKLTTPEREKGEELLSDVICLLVPCRLIAIGNDAHVAARRTVGRLHCQHEVEILKARHPSFGGKKDFKAGMRKIYPKL